MLFGRHIVELNGTDNSRVRSYVWGLDLSGTIDGAGGVGGLLWVTLHGAPGLAAGMHFCLYDGNGNVVALASASDGSATARYEYGAFGESIRVTGPAAALNPFRFSTKRTCNTTDLVLYEYRAYSASLGRWLSRDPLGEKGFKVQRGGRLSFIIGELSCYLFVNNSSLSHIDWCGLDLWVIRECSGISHRWVVGNNADGTYWSTDFMPDAETLLGRLCCRGTVYFREKELTLIPTNLPAGFCIELHVKADQDATDHAKAAAHNASACNPCEKQRYIPGLNDCRHWAKRVVRTAEEYQKRKSRPKPEEGSDGEREN